MRVKPRTGAVRGLIFDVLILVGRWREKNREREQRGREQRGREQRGREERKRKEQGQEQIGGGQYPRAGESEAVKRG